MRSRHRSRIIWNEIDPGTFGEFILGMFAPARTPTALIEQLNAEINRVLNLPEVKQQLFDSGAEAAPGTTAELAAIIKSDMATTGKVMRRTEP